MFQLFLNNKENLKKVKMKNLEIIRTRIRNTTTIEIEVERIRTKIKVTKNRRFRVTQKIRIISLEKLNPKKKNKNDKLLLYF